MNRILLITTALCFAAGAARAGGNHDQHGGTAPQPTYNATANNTAVAGAAARSAAAAHSSANASAMGGLGGRGGHGGAGGSATGGSTGPVTVNNTTGGGYNGPRYTTPDANAPSIVTANECALPRSFGISVILAALTGGWANESENCKRDRMARALERSGDWAAAREVRCLEDDMRRAAYSSGRPCAADIRGWNRH